MKKYLLVLMLLPMFLMGCEEPEPTPLPLGELELTGTWEWTETSWASPQEPLTPETEGYTLHLTLTEENEFVYYHDQVMVDRGTFKPQKQAEGGNELNYVELYSHITSSKYTRFYELIEISDDNHVMTTYQYPYTEDGRALRWRKLNNIETEEILGKK